MINRGVLDSVRGTLDAIDALNLTAQTPPRAMVLEELAGGTDKAFVFIRGNPVQRGKPVEPRFLSALSGGSARPFDVNRIQRADTVKLRRSRRSTSTRLSRRTSSERSSSTRSSSRSRPATSK